MVYDSKKDLSRELNILFRLVHKSFVSIKDGIEYNRGTAQNSSKSKKFRSQLSNNFVIRGTTTPDGVLPKSYNYKLRDPDGTG
jgi:hypothetical protein